MVDPYSKYVQALEDEALLSQLLAEPGMNRPGLESKIICEFRKKTLSKKEKTLFFCAASILFCLGSYWGYTIPSYLETSDSNVGLIFVTDGLTL